MNKLRYVIFSLFVNYLLFIAYLCIPILKYRKKSKSTALLFLPYTPSKWPGGEDRMASWKPYFKNDGINCTIHWAWEREEIENFYEAEKSGNSKYKYKLYYKLLFTRIKILFRVRNYDTIWVQRAWVPAFPFKHAYFEKLISRIHPRVIYDFYDADYVHNQTLVDETAQYAYRISVASNHLYQYFVKLNTNTVFLRFAIETQSFVPKIQTDNNKVIIGWMGSPDNALRVKEIAEVLKFIEQKFDYVWFSFTCRNMPDLGLNRVIINRWGENNFDYDNWLANIDIGIVPYIEPTETAKAKIAMKGLEFMANGVSMVVSPYILSDKLVHQKSCLIAESENEWKECLSMLCENEPLRNQIGLEAKQVFEKYHTFSQVYNKLKEVLDVN
jgi:glycosyltransferase involved in cell wall biosynthesis